MQNNAQTGFVLRSRDRSMRLAMASTARNLPPAEGPRSELRAVRTNAQMQMLTSLSNEPQHHRIRCGSIEFRSCVWPAERGVRESSADVFWHE